MGVIIMDIGMVTMAIGHSLSLVDVVADNLHLALALFGYVASLAPLEFDMSKFSLSNTPKCT